MSSTPSGLITLTTDFGTSDHFVGVMKGVILGIAPRARLVDITHNITPFEVNEGAFVIAQAWRHFPKGTIHVVVVDPGVGSARRPILIETSGVETSGAETSGVETSGVETGGHYFIGPDNGVFSIIYDAATHKVREITNPKVMLSRVSRTFHGRDVFAPAAAHLARKTPPARFGKLVRDAVRSAALTPARTARNQWTGRVLKTDRFGNLITNFHVDSFADVKTQPFELRVGLERIHRLALTYSETELGEVFVIAGSSGYLEVAANQGDAAKITGCGVGAPVELEVPA
ncbi:MAG TPA: SAM-dependent chlorinase/fluorinase [Bryobacteraceae bacterium]|nr:SAM-dependent chlorinase/fluorinase [Bryobacteraceae bacterium]